MDKGIGCGTVFIVVFILLLAQFILAYCFVKRNNAPTSCIFARDIITCIQVSKK